jgi:peptidoglycan/xylan/chitin deacetylase (PgdA/CDA1 family)
VPASSTVRSAAARAAASPAFARVVDLLERFDGRGGVLTVLMYHRIDEVEQTPALDPALLSATPVEFARQMDYLAARRPVLSLSELLEVRRGERPLPAGAVMVTFDDAYRDFADHAWPVLRRAGLPVTLFVPTAYPGRPARAFWWDRLYAALGATSRREPLDTPAGRLAMATPEDRARVLGTLRRWIEASPHGEAMAAVDRLTADLGAPPPVGCVLSWAELRGLAAEGVALAPHSRTHPRLDRLSFEDAQAEIAGSARDLERELGSAPPVFAFPGGGHSSELLAWLPEGGFEVAFTTLRGGNDLRDPNWLALRRVNVGRRSSLPVVRAQLLSWLARRGTPLAPAGAT